MLEFIPIADEQVFSFWEPYYKEFSIRYYWIPNTYFNIQYNCELVGVGGLHKLRKDGHYLMRGCYVLSQFRKSLLNVADKGIHQHSIEFRINLAREMGAKVIWVRCNKNSINNYKKYGFELVLDNGKQYVPLCLKLTD